MKAIRLRLKILPYVSLAFIIIYITTFKLFRMRRLNKNSLYVVLNQRDDIPRYCEDDNFIISFDEERYNWNAKKLLECKNKDIPFEPSLRTNMQYVNKYAFNVSHILLKRLQLDRSGIEKLAFRRKNDTKLPIFVTALSDNHLEEFIDLFKSIKKN